MSRGASVYTLRPTTRDERGCVCPFPPGCWATPCRSRGTRWEVRALVRERHAWATSPVSSVISEERRAAELARIAAALDIARAAMRARSLPGKAPAEPAGPPASSGWAAVLAELDHQAV